MTADVSRLPVVQQTPTPPALQIQSWEEMLARAEYFAKSQLIPQSLRGKPHDITIILQMGMEVGFNPLQALNSIDVIQGKPAIKPEAQLALIYQRCPNAFIQIKADPAKLSVTVQMGRNGAPQFETTWDIARARSMDLVSKDNYKKQPLVMLKWRAIGEAARTIFPDIIRGLYNTEEAEDFAPKQAAANDIKSRFESREVKDVPSQVDVPVEAYEAPQQAADPGLESVGHIITQRFQQAAQAKAESIAPAKEAEYVVTFGKFKGQTLAQIGADQVRGYSDFIQRKATEENKAVSGAAAEFVSRAYDFLNPPEGDEDMFL
jgi:hypothetical protein